MKIFERLLTDKKFSLYKNIFWEYQLGFEILSSEVIWLNEREMFSNRKFEITGSIEITESSETAIILAVLRDIKDWNEIEAGLAE